MATRCSAHNWKPLFHEPNSACSTAVSARWLGVVLKRQHELQACPTCSKVANQRGEVIRLESLQQSMTEAAKEWNLYLQAEERA